MHDGIDARTARAGLPSGIASGSPSGAVTTSLHIDEAARGSMLDLVAAFNQVAAGVEGTHRMLLERVEVLSRELESARRPRMAGSAQSAAVTAHAAHTARDLACDGRRTLADVERETILATLERFGGHRDRSAKALGIGVRTLGMKLRQWKLEGLAPSNA